MARKGKLQPRTFPDSVKGPLYVHMLSVGIMNPTNKTYDYKQGFNDARVAREILPDYANGEKLVRGFRLRALGKPSVTPSKRKSYEKGGIDPIFMQRVDMLCEKADAVFNITMLLARRLNISADEMGLELAAPARKRGSLTRAETQEGQRPVARKALKPGFRRDGKPDKRFKATKKVRGKLRRD